MREVWVIGKHILEVLKFVVDKTDPETVSWHVEYTNGIKRASFCKHDKWFYTTGLMMKSVEVCQFEVSKLIDKLKKLPIVKDCKQEISKPAINMIGLSILFEKEEYQKKEY